MKDYSATITVTIGFQAQNEDQAQERAAEIADRLMVGPADRRVLPDIKLPSWYDDSPYEASVEDVTCESE